MCWYHHWFPPRDIVSKKRSQKFYTDDIWVVILIGWRKFLTNQISTTYLDLGSDVSSVWHFHASSWKFTSRWNHWNVGCPYFMTTEYPLVQQHLWLVILRLWLTTISILESQISLYVFSFKWMKAFSHCSICILLAVHNELPLIVG